jgi:hypothetical protein
MFTPSAHTHAISDVTGLQSALDGKQAAGSYETAGAAASAVSAHESAGDPHPQYTSAAEAAAAAPVQSVAGRTGAVTLNSSDVGLGNVENTSDATKQASFLSAIRDGVASAYDTLAKIVTEFTAALNTKAPSASPTLTGSIYANGPLQHNVVAVGAGTTIDCALGTYFTKSMSGAWTPTISNVPASRAFGFVVEVAWTSGALTLPAGWSWAGGMAPTLSSGSWLLTWVTSDGGSNGVVVAQKRGA